MYVFESTAIYHKKGIMRLETSTLRAEERHKVRERCFLKNRQMKHKLDATLCRFYFCRVTLHVSGASAHHQEYLKLVQRPLVHVLSL